MELRASSRRLAVTVIARPLPSAAGEVLAGGKGVVVGGSGAGLAGDVCATAGLASAVPNRNASPPRQDHPKSRRIAVSLRSSMGIDTI
jgi:hypothetical protein